MNKKLPLYLMGVAMGFVIIFGVTYLFTLVFGRPLIVDTIEGYFLPIFIGLWHGVLLPFSLIISFFDKDSAIYVMNSNALYMLGYLFGVIINIFMSKTYVEAAIFDWESHYKT
jgi:hypothetical protein